MYNELNWIEEFIQGNFQPTDVYTEAYIGRLPELVTVSKLFEKIQTLYMDSNRQTDPNDYAETAKIRKILTKLFGVKDVVITWIPYENAWASTPVLFSVLKAQNSYMPLEFRKTGYYDSSHTRVFGIIMWTGLLNKDIVTLTGDEITAILLHETGHALDENPLIHFAPVINGLTTIVNKIFKAEVVTPMNVNEIFGRNIDETYNTYIPYIKKYIPDFQKYLNFMSDVMHKVKETTFFRLFTSAKYEKALIRRIRNWIGNVQVIWSTITEGGKIVTEGSHSGFLRYMAISVPRRINKNRSEQFADSVAAMYGYGVETIRALEKLDRSYGWNTRSPLEPKSKIQDVIMDLQATVYELLTIMIQDPHGTYQQRNKNLLIKLKRDLDSSDYPVEMKEYLKEDITKLEAQYDLLLSVDRSEMRTPCLAVTRKIIDKLFDGRPDIKRIFGFHQA